MRIPPILLAVLLPAVALAAPPLHQFRSVAVSPDGQRVASVEDDDVATDTAPPAALVIRDLAGHAATVALPCAAGPDCRPASPTWSADGRQLAFLIDRAREGAADIEVVDAAGGTPRRLLAFDGPLDRLRFGPGDRLAVLATAGAHKRVGRTEAAAPLQGEVGTAPDEQRIAVLDGQALRFASPPELYVYEFDWRPDGGFVGTAARGDGDASWWVARLYAFDAGRPARLLFAPGPREQLAAPAVSPDGRRVAFIGGWMSDFGSTGGDAFLLPLDRPGAVPVNLTAGRPATVTAIDWRCGDGLTGVTLSAGRVAVARLDAAGPVRPAWSGAGSISADDGNPSLSCSRHGVATVAQDFTTPPEIMAGPLDGWHALTRANAGMSAPLVARSIGWRGDGGAVQGWLLSPAPAGPGRRPMVVVVHGGPEAAARPVFAPARSLSRALLAQGWDVFEPNYRGSFGQGERFAQGSIGDLGGGDWRDVLGGVDAALRAASADPARLGIVGGSYGGYMAMWAVTQTHRFRAAVADAGVSDWLSIEGEAPQAGSDQVNFGGSVYDDPAPYLRASPITHMRGVTTPVLIAVGERDLECPMPQSQEFYAALQALGVPNSFVVYPGEGHALRREADRDDLQRRTVAWFKRWFDAR